MSSIFASLQTAANSLSVFQQAMSVVQSNVTNASTPGYVTQNVSLVSTVLGGVATGPLEDSRSTYAEKSVWNQNEQLGFATVQANSLDGIQSQFDVTGQTGVPAALSKLYSAFSSFSTSPTDNTVRTNVLTAAQQVVQAFNQMASKLQASVRQTNQQIGSTVDQINQLVSKVVAVNVQIRNSGNSTSLQSQLYNALEQISNLTPISVHIETDGSATILMSGQVPLVVGETQTELKTAYPSSTSPAIPGGMPKAEIVTSHGQDVTSLATGGQLGGLLQVRNTTLPSLIGDETEQGSVNQLAQGIADRVNSILTNGQVSAGPPAVSGSPLFTYDTSSPTGAASSLALSSGASAATLAAIDPGPPVVANGVATQLANLQNPTHAADMINGRSFTDFYSGIATDIGSQASNASELKDTQTDLFNQAENLRSQISGVSLDDQAAQLLQYQHAYEASSKMISVLNDVTGYLMGIIPS